MPNVNSYENGMPIWADVMVETTGQREAVMKFYTALHGWTWVLEVKRWVTTRSRTTMANP